MLDQFSICCIFIHIFGMTKWPSEYMFYHNQVSDTSQATEGGVKSKYLSGAKLEALHFSSLERVFACHFLLPSPRRTCQVESNSR